MAEGFCLSVVANTLASLAVNYLFNPAERRIRYFCSFHNIVAELHQSQEDLKKKRTDIQEAVEEAKLQNQEIEGDVVQWLKNVENALGDEQSLKDRIEESGRCCRNLFPNWSWRSNRLCKDVEKKIDVMRKLVQDSNFEQIGRPIPPERPNLDLVPPKDFVAFRSSVAAFNRITEALRDDQVKKIGVWGMGGVGKTTLVRKVGGEVTGFDRVILVTVSATPDIEKIQQKIADEIDLKFNKKTVDVKANELWNGLKGGKFLIILDDLWIKWNDDKDLRTIGIPLVENGKGCKIILTTRRNEVCVAMGCPLAVPVDVLENDEAWALFRKNAKLDERRLPEDIIEVAMKVAGECKGLPIAIITLGSALKNANSLGEWEVALDKLESNRLTEIGNIEEEEKNAYMCIKTSYEYVNSETTKKCLLLCALFPEDHSIDVEDLVRYAWGLGLYSKAGSVKEVRVDVLGAIGFLKDSCLLLEGERKGKYHYDGTDYERRYVKLHDIVRDVALWIASKEKSGFMIKSRLDQLRNETFECCKAISLLNSKEKKFPVELEYPKLKIMLLKNCDVQGTCFRGMTELKVLTLMVAKDSPRIVSLYALRSLRKLRALHLENFEDVKYLGDLATLEILSLRGSGFEGFADELGRLVHLRILDLTRCQFSSNFPLNNVFGRMSKLEELYLKGSNIEKVTGDILVEINSLSRLTVLSLGLYSLHFREDFKLPEKLERYEISITAADESCCFYITEKSWEIKGVIPSNVFSLLRENLESLKVSYNLKLTNLGSISELPTQHVRLEGLVELRIVRCPSLKSLFSLCVAQSLVLLETLEIWSCNELKRIVTELDGDGIEEISSSINSNSLCFPKLRKLDITDCPVLEYIFPTSKAPKGLITLEITDCPRLNDSAVQFEAEKALFSLWDVRLSTFKESFSASKHLELFGITRDHNLVPDANEEGLNGLTSLNLWLSNDLKCLVDTTTGNLPPSSAFSNLETLEMTFMDGLERLCKGQPPQGFLNNLKQLDVRNCEKLEVLFEMDEHSLEENKDQPLSNLQSLKLDYLPELRWILEGSFSLKSLKVVKIESCSELESLFSPSLIQSLEMLEQLSIRKCRELKTIFADGDIESNSSCSPVCLPKLKALEIWWCWKLEYVVPITLAQGLPALELVTIRECDELKQVYGMGKEEDGVAHHDTRNVLLPSLQQINLHKLKSLTSFVPEKYVVKAPALRSLEVKACPELRNFPIQQQEVNNKQLKLGFQDITISIFKELPCFTKQLHLIGFGHHKNVIPDVYLDHLHGLTFLKIEQWTEIQCVIDIPELRWIVKGPTTNCVILQCLKHLTISYCSELEYLFSASVVQTLSPLEELNMLSCNKLKSVFMKLEGDDDDESNTLCCFPNLKTLKIGHCSSLEYVFPHALAPSFHRLEKIHLDSLRRLKSVVAGNNICFEAPALVDLYIDRCPAFTYFTIRPKQGNTRSTLKELKFSKKDIDGEDGEPCNMTNTQTSPKFECLTLGNSEQLFQLQGGYFISRLEKVKLEHLISLRDIWKGPMQVATVLKELELYHCNNLTYIFAVMLIEQLPQLSTLMIKSCEKLKQIIADDDILASSSSSQFPQSEKKITLHHLKTIVLENLPRLESLSLMGYQLEFPQLSTLKIKSCENLKQIIPGDDILASLSSSQVPRLEKKMAFPHLKKIVLENLPRLESFSPVGYQLEFPCLKLLDIKQCLKMITSFTVDHLKLIVHAKTVQASCLEQASPSQENIFWKRHRPTKGLLQHIVEDAHEISPMK